jgi:hypothetical protein
MKVARIVLADSIRWNIRHADPKSIPLRFLEGLRLINPLVPVRGWRQPLVAALGGDIWHVVTDGLTFVMPDEFTTDDLADRLVPFIRAIRVASRQASLLDRVVFTANYSASRLPSLVQPQPSLRRGELFGSYRIKTALTFDLVRRVSHQDKLADYHLYDEILLDALNAHESSDYRQAILYAAIAMESLASSVLEQKYSEILAKSKPPSHVNILTSPLPRGEVWRGDPIYRLLTKTDNFTRLLHEAPLYLLRRSMRSEDEGLYQSCERLYGQRNRLGHGKPLKPEDLPLDRNGALEALKVAIRAFQWFGSEGFHAPVLDGVPVGELARSH